MASFGQQLMRERERRGWPRSRVAKATEIYIHDLAALEFGDFDALPEDPVVEGFVRTYAEFLGIDVEAIVAEFHSSRPIRETLPAEPPVEAEPEPEPELVPEPEPEPQLVQATAAPEPIASPVEPAPEPAVECGSAPASPEPIRLPPQPRPRRRRNPWLPVVAVAGAVIGLAIWWSLSAGGPEAEPLPNMPPPSAPSERSAAAAEERVLPAPSSEVPKPAASPPAATGALRVTAHGVGADVVDRRLVGEADQFVAGSRVWFWTRVEGGGAGSTIHHVWLHEGRVVERITLDVGSPRWRTQSAKKVYREGRWAVEVRDASGVALARSGFTCVP